MTRIAMKLALLLGIVLSSRVAFAGPLRVALVSDVTVLGDVILLSHLLPADLTGPIRGEAERIVLGNAPEFGATRILDGESIRSSLTRAGLDVMDFDVPPAVHVCRSGFPLPKKLVWDAIEAAAATRGVALPGGLRPEDLEWAVPVFLPASDSRVAVREIRFDKFQNRLRFRLSLVANPKAPSFYAWCSPQTQRPAADSMRWRASGEIRGTPATVAQPEPVSIRRPAMLHLHSLNSAADLLVRPLQPGAIGETVRVRIFASGHTLLARVVGPDLLDASF